MSPTDGEFDFEGDFYKVTKGYIEQKPKQKPYPTIMNAGGSVQFASHDLEVSRQGMGILGAAKPICDSGAKTEK